jgi:hypothetical protein
MQRRTSAKPRRIRDTSSAQSKFGQPARDFDALVTLAESAGPRWLPAATAPGDVLLIECAGAYGAVMSSRYDLREPAEECVLE